MIENKKEDLIKQTHKEDYIYQMIATLQVKKTVKVVTAQQE